jgi:hypothetical protein
VVVDDDEGNVRDDLEDGAVLEGDSALLQRLEEQRIEEEEDVATRRQRIKERLASRRQEAQDMNEEREAHKGAHRGIGDVIRVMAKWLFGI